MVVRGVLTLDDVTPHLIDLEYFIPEQVGLPSLVPTAMSPDDHDFHEFFSITPADDGEVICSGSEFLSRVRLANKRGWFCLSV